MFLREAVPRQTWIAVATVFAGITVIFTGSLGGGNPVGDLSAVGSAFSFAGALVIFRRTRAVDMAPTVALSGLVLAVVVAPLATPLAIDARSLAYLLVLGALVIPISFVLLVTAPRYLPAPDVALVMLLEAVLGPLWVWLVLAEVPARETFLGSRERMPDSAKRRPAVIAIAASLARTGHHERALELAGSIESARYRALVVAQIGLAQANSGDIAAALETLDALFRH